MLYKFQLAVKEKEKGSMRAENKVKYCSQKFETNEKIDIHADKNCKQYCKRKIHNFHLCISHKHSFS